MSLIYDHRNFLHSKKRGQEPAIQTITGSCMPIRSRSPGCASRNGLRLSSIMRTASRIR